MRSTLLTLFCLPLLAGCLGFSSTDNEMIGQVKYVKNVTPLLVPGYFLADVSLGVMRGGVGSISKSDKQLFAVGDELQKKLKHAAETGEIVKIAYREHRVVLYGPDYEATSVEAAP